MILRSLAFVVGLALLCATAHVTISYTGGYGTPHAVLVMAIAAGVGVGALSVGAAWAARRRGVARWLVVAILAGEAFGFLMTAERLVTGREAQQAPLRVAAEAFDKARRRLQQAQGAVSAAAATSGRLEAALAAKSAADAAVVEKSAERACATNCRHLLQAQVDDAAHEVAAARAEIETGRVQLEDELRAARVALAGTQAPASATPLADRIGMPAWLLDLITAALGSMAANGLACGLIAFSAHHRKREPEVAEVVVEPAPVIRPAEHAARFAVEALQPAEGGHLDLMAIHVAYRDWCHSKGLQPLSAAQIGQALAHLFDGAGIAVREHQGRLTALGVSLAGGGSDSLALIASSSSSRSCCHVDAQFVTADRGGGWRRGIGSLRGRGLR